MERKNVDAVKYVTELGSFEVFSLFLSLSPLSLSLFVLLRGGKALCQEVTLQSRVDINVGVQRTWKA